MIAFFPGTDDDTYCTDMSSLIVIQTMHSVALYSCMQKHGAAASTSREWYSIVLVVGLNNGDPPQAVWDNPGRKLQALPRPLGRSPPTRFTEGEVACRDLTQGFGRS